MDKKDLTLRRSKQLRFLGNELFFLGPTLVFFVGIILLAFALSIGYSFTDWNGVTNEVHFVGLENFKKLLTDRGYWNAFGFTFRYAVAAVILNNVLGLILALMITSLKRGTNFYRTTIFIPYAMSAFVLGFIWRFIFIKGFPVIGELTGLSFFSQKWLGTPSTAYWGLVIMSVWKHVGYVMVIYIAGLATVPEDILEASCVDGATALQQIFRIKLPMLMPSVTVCLFMSINWAFNIFDMNLSMTAGGPYNTTMSVSLNIYYEAFKYFKNGYATAKALLFFLVVALISILQTRLTSKREVDL